MNPPLELDFWLRLLGILALEISLVFALAFAVQSFTKSAVWRRTIWQGCLVCLLLLVTSDITGLGRGVAVWFAGKPPVERKVSVRIIPADEQFIPTPIENEIPMPTVFSEKETPVTRSIWWPGILWLAGLGLILARILFARILFVTLRWRKTEITDATLLNRVSELAQRLGIRRKIHLLESPGFRSPMTFGIAQSCVALPEGFSEHFTPAEQNAMLTHELAHVAARDSFWYLLADLTSALLWWHPLVWLARLRLHSASELAADEAAAILENGPGTLAECLVNLGQRMTQSRSFGWLGVDGNGFRSHLAQRVERLLNLKEARQPMRGWRIFLAKTSMTVVFASLVIFTSGWIQNRGAQRPKNLKTALQQSWNNSFASVAAIALAESKTESAPQSDFPGSAEAQSLAEYEIVSLDTVFYDDVLAEHVEIISRRALELEDNQGILILSSNELSAVLLALSDLPSTYDLVGSKFSGGRFLYYGAMTNEYQCTYLTKSTDGINRIEGAEMTYIAANSWRFSFVPRKLESGIQIDLEWPNAVNNLTKEFEMPNHGGAIIRRAIPGDPTRHQLILFSSLRVFPKTQIGDANTPVNNSNVNEETNRTFRSVSDQFGKKEPSKDQATNLADLFPRFFHKRETQDGTNLIAVQQKAFSPVISNHPEPFDLNKLNGNELFPKPLANTKSREELWETLKGLPLPHFLSREPAQNQPVARSNVVYATKGRQAIAAKLDRIHFREVRFDKVPLGEVLKVLRSESKARDPDSVGVNFLFNSNPVPATNASSSPPVDLNEIAIHITPALVDVRLAEVLDAIVQVSDKPIQYAIEDYAVVFSPKRDSGIALYTRVFKVDPKTFGQALDHVSPQNLISTNRQEAVNVKVRKFLEAAGVEFDAPGNLNGKSVFFKDTTGMLMVRATMEDLEKISAAIETLVVQPAQIVIETKLVEISEAAMKKMGSDWLIKKGIVPLTNQTASDLFLTGTNVLAKTIATNSAKPIPAMGGIFTDLQYQRLLRELEKMVGVDILTPPKVTTLSGRQAQVAVLDLHTVVLGRNPVVGASGVFTNGYQTENIRSGPVLDVLPTAAADGLAIQLSLTGNVNEFLGYYDANGKKTAKTTGSEEPRARIRTMQGEVNVWDGQTVILSHESREKFASERKTLFMFVTATIIDPAGNRVNSVEDVPFTENSVPKQPLPKQPERK